MGSWYQAEPVSQGSSGVRRMQLSPRKAALPDSSNSLTLD